MARQAEAAGGGSDSDDPDRDYFRRDSEQIGRPHAVAVFGKDSGAEGRLRADLGKVGPTYFSDEGMSKDTTSVMREWHKGT
jgi:hypothetical protein